MIAENRCGAPGGHALQFQLSVAAAQWDAALAWE